VSDYGRFTILAHEAHHLLGVGYEGLTRFMVTVHNWGKGQQSW
jgi:hypothetical protein